MEIKVTIKGLTPLLMNRFTEQAEIDVSSGTRVSIKSKNGSPREEAAAKCYKESDGNLFIPGTNIFAALVAAGTFHKVGKSKLTTLKSSLIPAGIAVIDLVCPLNTNHWEVDSRSVVIPSTGGRIMCHRPRIDDWEASFTIEVDTEMFNEKTVRILVDDAGKKIGLGDYRPQRKGPFGRFVVKHWEIINSQPSMAVLS